MKWRLPQNTTRCPLKTCGEAYENRSALKLHYQQQHASTMVLCEICEKPLRAQHVSTYVKHYRDKHPDSGLPTNLIRSMRKSIHGRPTEHVSLIIFYLIFICFCIQFFHVMLI